MEIEILYKSSNIWIKTLNQHKEFSPNDTQQMFSFLKSLEVKLPIIASYIINLENTLYKTIMSTTYLHSIALDIIGRKLLAEFIGEKLLDIENVLFVNDKMYFPTNQVLIRIKNNNVSVKCEESLFKDLYLMFYNLIKAVVYTIIYYHNFRSYNEKFNNEISLTPYANIVSICNALLPKKNIMIYNYNDIFTVLDFENKEIRVVESRFSDVIQAIYYFSILSDLDFDEIVEKGKEKLPATFIMYYTRPLNEIIYIMNEYRCRKLILTIENLLKEIKIGEEIYCGKAKQIILDLKQRLIRALTELKIIQLLY